MTVEIKRGKTGREKVIGIVKRLIELKKEFWERGNREEPYSAEYYVFHGKSDGMEIALTVIDGELDFDPEIHKLIDDSRK